MKFLNNKRGNVLLAIVLTAIMSILIGIPFFYIFSGLTDAFLESNPSIMTRIAFFMFPVFVILGIVYFFFETMRGNPTR